MVRQISTFVPKRVRLSARKFDGTFGCYKAIKDHLEKLGCEIEYVEDEAGSYLLLKQGIGMKNHIKVVEKGQFVYDDKGKTKVASEEFFKNYYQKDMVAEYGGQKVWGEHKALGKGYKDYMSQAVPTRLFGLTPVPPKTPTVLPPEFVGKVFPERYQTFLALKSAIKQAKIERNEIATIAPSYIEKRLQKPTINHIYFSVRYKNEIPEFTAIRVQDPPALVNPYETPGENSPGHEKCEPKNDYTMTQDKNYLMEVTDFAVTLFKDIYEKVQDDGKLSIWEAISLLPQGASIAGFIERGDEAERAFRNLDRQTRMEIVDHVYAKFELDNEKAEAVVEESLNALASIALTVKLVTGKGESLENLNRIKPYYEGTINEVARERKEQIEKHGYTMEWDENANQKGQLTQAAVALLDEQPKAGAFPGNWDKDIVAKMTGKPYRKRLVIAAALIVAEIDRVKSK